MQEVCEEVLDTRSTPVVYKKIINDSNGTALGTVKILEFEEVVDSVVRFLTKTLRLIIISYRIFVACLE